MDKKLKIKIESFLNNRKGQISIELSQEDAYLNDNAENSYSKLEAALNDKQKKLLFEYEFHNNLRLSAENEQYYRLGFFDAMIFLLSERKEYFYGKKY